jgi:hypothetical protein
MHMEIVGKFTRVPHDKNVGVMGVFHVTFLLRMNAYGSLQIEPTIIKRSMYWER